MYYFLSQPKIYSSLTPQLKEVIIKVAGWSQTIATNEWDLYKDTGFYSGQTSHLNMKILTFAENESLYIF